MLSLVLLKNQGIHILLVTVTIVFVQHLKNKHLQYRVVFHPFVSFVYICMRVLWFLMQKRSTQFYFTKSKIIKIELISISSSNL